MLKSIGIQTGVYEENSSIIYVIDPRFQIVYCNLAWDVFAQRNNGIGLERARAVGQSVMHATPEALREFYEDAYHQVIQGGEPWEHDYECSSAEVSRFFHMRVLGLPEQHLLVENSLVVERPHDPQRLKMPPIETMYLDHNRIIVMCAHCRRTRRISTDPPVWDWVPAFVNHLPERASHGLCPSCRAYYFPQFPSSLSARN